MKAQVIYFSKTGNTKKVAEAIATGLGAKAVDVRSGPEIAKGSIVFLGSGCYANRPGRALLKFIEKNDFSGVKVALFGTSSEGAGREVLVMEKKLEQKGAVIKGKFFCKGKFLFTNKGHPSGEELKGAADFARKTASILQQAPTGFPTGTNPE